MVKHSTAAERRKGWDDTVREMAKHAKVAPAAPPKKRETRRRAAATKNRWVSAATSDTELRAASRIDMILGTNYYEKEQKEDDDDYTEEERSSKKQRAVSSSSSASKTAKDVARERRHRPKNIAQILLDDFYGKDWDPSVPDYLSIAAGPSRYPAQKTCVITGEKANYTDPVTGCHYKDAAAFAQLRENPPPWVKAHTQGAPYFEAIKQIQTERAAKLQKLRQEGKDPTMASINSDDLVKKIAEAYS
ncbi:hypothetical protein CTAYLR_005124 [Chrysophaeum taylorii]|uniref:Vps72/YL1 C-terminal domain-containing protein n=1 Tax=Chrysophaeum taylorii TaxID=2483200 RepID=A0AAD7XM56_9STRA|nr:hypothetical protein CTAYLR_005124 [Chrysophaeum taylorii]